METVKNKLGIEIEYSEEIAQDLYAVHGIKVRELFESMYGTQFDISKTFNPETNDLQFILSTNDSRDEIMSWSMKAT